MLFPGYARNENKDGAPFSARERLVSQVSVDVKNRELKTVYIIINERRGKCDVHIRKCQREGVTGSLVSLHFCFVLLCICHHEVLI